MSHRALEIPEFVIDTLFFNLDKACGEHRLSPLLRAMTFALIVNMLRCLSACFRGYKSIPETWRTSEHQHTKR